MWGAAATGWIDEVQRLTDFDRVGDIVLGEATRAPCYGHGLSRRPSSPAFATADECKQGVQTQHEEAASNEHPSKRLHQFCLTRGVGESRQAGCTLPPGTTPRISRTGRVPRVVQGGATEIIDRLRISRRRPRHPPRFCPLLPASARFARFCPLRPLLPASPASPTSARSPTRSLCCPIRLW